MRRQVLVVERPPPFHIHQCLAGAIATLLFILIGALSWINLKLSARQMKI